jgi:uncharacterized protein (DUF2252 family)
MKSAFSTLPTPKNRQVILVATRNLKMARSAHAYVRGNTLKFYEWLDALKRGRVPHGPPVWICGDCHVGNLGPVADATGRIEIQVRDLDQTVIGNPAHDLIRLGLSLASAARGSDLGGVTTAKMLEQMMEGYERAFEDEIGDNKRKKERPESVHIVLNLAASRSWKHLAKERLEGTKPNIPLGRRFWPISKQEKRNIEKLFETEESRRLVTLIRSRDEDATFEVLDAAYWVKGCSSLGRLRYAALLGIASKAKQRDFCLMDLKEGVQAAAPRYANGKVPRDNAERVVEGARHLTPFLGERMLADRLLDRAIVMRELRPQDLKLEIAQLTREEAMKTASFLANVVGKAHAQQMNETCRNDWRDELQKNRSKALDAPSWLWSAVVELLVSHEQGYLEHCRRYALGNPEDARISPTL